MSDLIIVIYPEDMIEGSEEHQLLIAATNGDRCFNLLGNKYAVTECLKETFFRQSSWALFNKRYRVTITAMKMTEAK